MSVLPKLERLLARGRSVYPVDLLWRSIEHYERSECAVFATAAAFAGLSLYGYTTKRDLSKLGTFLVMGLVGILVAMLLNFFFQSGTLALVISILGVLIFAGLTASDTQKIKNMYDYVAGTDMAGKAAIMGALTLYLDFINLFQFLLAFLGNQRN